MSTHRAFFPRLRQRFERALRGPQVAGLVVVACGFLPGMLAGIQIGGLLFFLNPDLPFSRLPLLRTVGAYALLLGTATVLLHLPFTHASARRAQRLLPWGLSLALVLAAVLAGSHASYFAYYLPPGINVRLLKATISLSIAGLIAFYTALLHTLHRRPYGPRSRVGIVVMCIFAIYAILERRDAFQPIPESLRSGRVAEAAPRPKLVVVALEGATLDAVLPLAEEGRLPFFATLMRDGASSRLEGFRPYRRAALWTSLATGKHPYRHGIVGEEVFPASFLGPGAQLRLMPAGVGFRSWGTFGAVPRAVDRGDARALSLWQVLHRLGVRSGVVGWPVTAPTPQHVDFTVSERFFDDPGVPTSARPAELAERARLFRLGLDEVDPVAVARFGRSPSLAILRALSADGWRQSLSLFLLEERQPNALFIALPGLREVSKAYFGGFVASQRQGSPKTEQVAAAEWVAVYYSELDGFLQSLWERQDPATLLAVVSATGADRLRGSQRWFSLSAARRQLQGGTALSPDGAFFLYGPGVRKGARLTGARVVDVAPTLLYAEGFAIPRDMDGRVLTAAFQTEFLNRQPLTFVPSYETLPATGLAP